VIGKFIDFYLFENIVAQQDVIPVKTGIQDSVFALTRSGFLLEFTLTKVGAGMTGCFPFDSGRFSKI